MQTSSVYAYNFQYLNHVVSVIQIQGFTFYLFVFLIILNRFYNFFRKMIVHANYIGVFFYYTFTMASKNHAVCVDKTLQI